MFLVKTDDSWCHSGRFGEVPYFVCNDEDRFRDKDKGGSIYKLDSKDFQCDPQKGLGVNEWTSRVPAMPISKEVYDFGLIAMLNCGVQVYFVDPDKFEKINNSEDHGNQILRNSISENQKQDMNRRELPEIDVR